MSMSTQVQINRQEQFNSHQNTQSHLCSHIQQPILNRIRTYAINPKLSITPASIDPTKSKLETYKNHLLNIHLRKSVIPHVPEPSIISYFNLLKQQKLVSTKKQKLKKQLIANKKQYQKLKKTIQKYKDIYDSKQQSMKEKVLLSKILSTKLESEFEKTKEKFKQLQFSKIMNLAQKKVYFYQLGQIFFNDKTRNIFSLDKQLSRTDQEMGICLGYLGFLIYNVARITGAQMWLKFRFKGSKSSITIYDPKVIQNYSNTSLQGSSNLVILQQTFLLHPKETRMNQALNHLVEQLKQIMRYSLMINVGKSSNFYELCEELSKYLLSL